MPFSGDAKWAQLRTQFVCSYDKSISYYSNLVKLIGRKNHFELSPSMSFHRTDNLIMLTYHETDILTIDSNDVVTLNSGTWYTHETKTRMNAFAAPSFCIQQKKGLWYLHYNGHTSLFKDGAVLDLKNGTYTQTFDDGSTLELFTDEYTR